MNTAELPLLRWVKSDLNRFWMIVGGLPILLNFLRIASFQWEELSLSAFIWSLSFLGLLPDLLVLRLFLKYIKGGAQAQQPASSHSRLSIEETTSLISATGSPKDFFWAAAKTWGICFGVVWIFSFRFFGLNLLFSEVMQFGVSVACYSFALQQTRIVQSQDSHDATSRLIGTAALYLIAPNLVYGLYWLLFYGHLSFDLWKGLLGLLLSSVVLFFERQRYQLAQTTYYSKNPLYQIDAIDPVRATKDLLPLAYWSEVGFDGVLYRVEQSNVSDDPFRNNQVRIPLFLVPTQAEPFMSFLNRRFSLFVASFVVSLVIVVESLLDFF